MKRAESILLNVLSSLTLSWRRPVSYRNQSIDLQSKSMDWFLYDNGFCHERVRILSLNSSFSKRGTKKQSRNILQQHLSLYSNKLLVNFKNLFLKHSHCYCYLDPHRYISVLIIYIKSSSDIASNACSYLTRKWKYSLKGIPWRKFPMNYFLIFNWSNLFHNKYNCFGRLEKLIYN